MSTITRRRSSRDNEPNETPQDEEQSSTPARTRRKSSDEEEKPARRRSGGSGGFASFSQKKRSGGDFASDFRPKDTVLFKLLDAEPFDVYNQHWVTEGNASGQTRHSFVCREGDEYFEDDEGCPLCDLGETATTKSLFNVLDLTNPRKPEVKVWSTSPTVTEILERASRESKTSPLDKDDLYWEITVIKTKNKTSYQIVPVKARDLLEDYEIEPFTAEELASYKENLYDDRKAVTKVDSYEELEELANSLD